MTSRNGDAGVPAGHVALAGSERRPSADAVLLGPADANEAFRVTVILHRRADHAPFPELDFSKRAPNAGPLPLEEFARNFGADPADLTAVAEFAERFGLHVVVSDAARRAVVLWGTVDQMSRAFAVSLNRYQHTLPPGSGKTPAARTEVYRGRSGVIYVPGDLAPRIVGVFGLDNRTITHHNTADPADPPNTQKLSVETLQLLYNFPTNLATGQTIVIHSPTRGIGGYLQSDLDQYCELYATNLASISPTDISADSLIGPMLPNVPVANGSVSYNTTSRSSMGTSTLTFAQTDLIIPGSPVYGSSISVADARYLAVSSVNNGVVTLDQPLLADVPQDSTIFFNLDFETTQDICIAASAALGADIVVLFSNGDQQGWIDAIGCLPMLAPQCSVFSSSFYMLEDDAFVDPVAPSTVSPGTLTALSLAFHDAAMQYVTVCVGSGDYGAATREGSSAFGGDGKQHVIYPASDPYVLSVGGTTIGNVVQNPLSFDEFVWNDPQSYDPTGWGTTGGGVSAVFDLPWWQANAGVPVSLNGGRIGRGIPDVAANADKNSGIAWIPLAGAGTVGNGTSAATPLWAGLIAVINAALNARVGFINPSIYQFGSSVFRDIVPGAGPVDNGNGGVPGYPAGTGWDACTGWGSPNGLALLAAFQPLPLVYISGGYQGPDIIITDLATNQPVALTDIAEGYWDSLLQPSTAYGLSAVIHNDGATVATNVKVRFWRIPGGLGTNGTMVGTPQMVDVPAFGSITVPALANFMSAPLGGHVCAAVSIYSAATGCSVDATDALLIPNPGNQGSQACSAWRNTDSGVARPGSMWRLPLNIGKLIKLHHAPTRFRVRSAHVPAAWKEGAPVRELLAAMMSTGAQPRLPLYMLPAIRATFPPLASRIDVSANAAVHVQPSRDGEALFSFEHAESEAAFELAVEIPPTADDGDIVVLTVTADYPAAADRRPRSVEFIEVVHVRATG